MSARRGSSGARLGCAAALVLAVAACDRGPSAGESELLAELRALRQVLARSERAASAPAPAAAEIAEALTPLRSVLDALTANQRELQQRQLALTQELQRWSVLLVESTGTAQRDEGQAIAARLQQLEAALAAQEARQREVEQLVQRALDNTADRLEAFLQAVGAGQEPAPANGEPAETVPVPAPVPPQSEAAEDGATGDARTGRWDRRGTLMSWWGGVAVLCVLAGVVCLLRWRQAARAASFPVRRRDPATPEPETGEPDVQEIWAAAALLGEAVGRLRDSTAQDAPQQPEPPAHDGTNGNGSADADWIVLDDELLAPARSPAAEAPREAAAPTEDRPQRSSCHLRSDDPARAAEAVLRALQQDPRVLRRPEPAVRCAGDGLDVTFHLVPRIPPGERSHVEQRLRDACRGQGA